MMLTLGDRLPHPQASRRQAATGWYRYPATATVRPSAAER